MSGSLPMASCGQTYGEWRHDTETHSRRGWTTAGTASTEASGTPLLSFTLISNTFSWPPALSTTPTVSYSPVVAVHRHASHLE